MARIAAALAAARLIAPAAAVLIVAVGIGWPWGVVVAAACLLLPLAVVEIMMRLVPVHVSRPPEPRRPLRVDSMRIWPPRKALPGTAGESITEGKRP